MSSLNSLLSAIWRLPTTGPIPPASQDKSYNTNDFTNVFLQADTDHDGHLTQTELNTFKNIAYFRTDSNVQKNQEIASILSDNYNTIAYRALKQGEMTTMDMRSTDGTIELSEITKLASFDGNSNNITKSDVSQLQNGKTANWPQTTSTGGGGTGGTSNGILQQILRLLIQLLFGGGRGNFGGLTPGSPTDYILN